MCHRSPPASGGVPLPSVGRSGGGRGTLLARSWRVDRLGLGLRASVSSASAVVAAAVNKVAPDLCRQASRVGVDGGSGRYRSGRGCCGGGGSLVEDFVLWLRRRGGACSGVDTEPRSFLWSVLEEDEGQEGVWWSDGSSGARWTRRLSPADVLRQFRSNFLLVNLAAHKACWQGVLLLQIVGLKMLLFHRRSGDGFGFFLVERLKMLVLVFFFFKFLLLCSCLICTPSLL